jgi:type IX secretion system PorP/SprF family membrane protein
MKPWATISGLSFALCFAAAGSSIRAQDAVFSQQDLIPLALNPAFAGAVDDIGAHLIHRSQWSSIGDPFRTTGATFDTRLGRNRQTTSAHAGQLSLGVSFLSDHAGAMKTTRADLAVAYHVFLTPNSIIGAGITTGLLQTVMDGASGEWASQYDGIRYDPALPSGEAADTRGHNAFDLGGGLLYTLWATGQGVPDDRSSLNIGLSGQHLGRPAISADGTDRLPVRWSAFINGRWKFGRSQTYIDPGAYYHRQGPGSQLLAGSYIGHRFGPQRAFQNEAIQLCVQLGAFYRLDDAVVAKALFQWDAYSLGMAYDITVSSLARTNSGKGAAEIVLCYDLRTAR